MDNLSVLVLLVSLMMESITTTLTNALMVATIVIKTHLAPTPMAVMNVVSNMDKQLMVLFALI